MQKDKILHLGDKLSPDSELRLIETPKNPEGPDLVPTSDNSVGKDKTISGKEQEEGGEVANENNSGTKGLAAVVAYKNTMTHDVVAGQRAGHPDRRFEPIATSTTKAEKNNKKKYLENLFFECYNGKHQE